MSLDAIYAAHPVSERNILARLARQNVPMNGLTEWSLAIDPDTDITDQNHPGGVEAVLALAAAARVTAASAVIDVGAGIGGSARVLALAFGCSVLAVEREPERSQQAIRLTALVALADRVTCAQHDAMASGLPIENADVLWGQHAWSHFPSPELFLDRWLRSVRASGRIAISDGFLARAPAGHDESELMRDLEQLWAVHFVPLDRWRRALETRGCTTIHDRDRTVEAQAYFSHLLAVSSTWPVGIVTDEERRGWSLGGDALERGLIAMRQLVTVKS
jgi:predicted O-methyltransferase YrrM